MLIDIIRKCPHLDAQITRLARPFYSLRLTKFNISQPRRWSGIRVALNSANPFDIIHLSELVLTARFSDAREIRYVFLLGGDKSWTALMPISSGCEPEVGGTLAVA